MGTTPLWVPLVVAVIGLVATIVGTIVGVIITQRRSDRRENIAGSASENVSASDGLVRTQHGTLSCAANV